MANAIIHARGGSKRIPKKNIKLFHGKEMIAHPIKACLDSNIFKNVFVSTDCKEIAKIATNHGAKVPYLREAKFADDYSNTSEVLINDLKKLKLLNIHSEYTCCLYGTSAFTSPTHLIDALTLLKENKKTCSIIPITTYDFSIFRSFKYQKNCITPFYPDKILKRSQDLEEGYHDIGQFYWINNSIFEKEKTLYSNNSLGFKVSRKCIQDIDTPEDWEIAEHIYPLFKKKFYKSPLGK